MTHKIALITGSSRGIGAATAIKLAEDGYDICINYHSDKDAAQNIAEKVESLGSKSMIYQANVADEESVIAMFQAIDNKLGRISALINNMGILTTQMPLVEMDAKRINHILTNNVTSCFICCREAIKRMSTTFSGDGGVIVNVSSIAALLGGANEYTDYAASKGAIDTLTKGLAIELAEQGIRVNAVRPGFIDTDIHKDGGEPDRLKRVTPLIPMKRPGQADEVAEAIAWLVSDKSSYCTGSFIDCAGGR